jgi:SAM-dependent methyltransferase
MESVACVLCCSAERDVVRAARDRLDGSGARAADFRLVRCRSCGLVYLDPRPTPGEMPAYYPDVYHTQADVRRLVPRLEEAYRLRQHAEVVAWLAARRPARGRLLDVGCGAGELLAALRNDGWEVQGLEPSPPGAARGRSRHHLDIVEGTLEEADLPAGAYDVVVLSAVLEHLHDPLGGLERARGLLADGGLVAVLFLPMVDSLQARLFGSRWLALDVPRHLYHFTPATFELAVRRAGLRIESVVNYSRRHNAGMWTSSLLPGLQKQRLNLLSQRSRAKEHAGAAAYVALTAAARPLARAEASLGRSPIRSFFLAPS